jgi:hypothetical protein
MHVARCVEFPDVALPVLPLVRRALTAPWPGQLVAQVLTRRHHDHFWWDPETGETRPRSGVLGQ